MDDFISHFAYKDPLRPVYLFPDSHETCRICYHIIHGDAYASATVFSGGKPAVFIHERCAKLPKEVTYPFHSHLSLILQERPIYYYRCTFCSNSSYFHYFCSDCDFCVDVKCASLIPSKDFQNLINPPDSSIIPCQVPNHFQYSCNVCRRVIEGGVVYCDPKSSRLLHESCANLPEQIDHPFHPSHPLTLLHLTSSYPFMCYACGQRSEHHYCCSECEFYLDVNCAFLVPAAKNYESPNDVFTHQHPLVKCDQSRSVVISCSSCGDLCKGSVYVCVECHFILDESCLTLPSYLQHPFHWRHPLILYQSHHTSFFNCNACGHGPLLSFKYACLDCSFLIHTTCARPVPLTIDSKLHQHPLALRKKPTCVISYHNCRGECFTLSFCCLQCDYHFHPGCLPELPRVVKHERHLHPLSYTNSPIKDDSDEDEEAELYCNACETRRKLFDPTYYCADCHFVAHFDCCIDEILRQLEISSTKTNSQEDETQSSTANATILGEDTKDPVADAKIEYAELISEIARLEKERRERKKELRELKKQISRKRDRATFISYICNLEHL